MYGHSTSFPYGTHRPPYTTEELDNSLCFVERFTWMDNHTYAKYLVTMASFSSKNFSSGKFRKSSIDQNEIREKKKISLKKKSYLHYWQSNNWSKDPENLKTDRSGSL